ncbi:MAG: MBL fold metallo-hydrolase [Clostridia bacterium]|nr:MBL fold metallo-hydrolase [Clostridia bacterium]
MKKNNNKIIKVLLPILGAIIAIIAFSIYKFFFENEEYDIPDGSAEFHYIDVGQGDSTLILADGMTVLIDTGENDSKNTLINYLKDKKIETIDYFIITHFDSDHFGEATEVLEEFAIVNLIIPDQVKTTKMYTTFIQAVASKPDIYVSVIEDNDDIGNTIPVDDIIDIDSKPDRTIYVGEVDKENSNDKGDLELEFFGPVKDSYDNSNDYSIIVMARWGKNKMLFTGDAETKAEQALVDKYGSQLRDYFDCDVFKAGHHGSSTSSCKDILDAASPEYIIISCGLDNSYGHPHTEAMQRFENEVEKDDIYRTDLQGDIVLVTDGENITFTTEK